MRHILINKSIPIRFMISFMILGCIAPLLIHPAKAKNLSADLDQHLIKINTGFTGSDVLLFGTVDSAGDILVTIKGPPRDMEITKKKFFWGIWVRDQEVKYSMISSFYYHAISSPNALLLPVSNLKRHRIGVENIYFPDLPNVDSNALAGFKKGLIKAKIKDQSYRVEPGRIERRGDNLFRLSVHFPADVPVGTYMVETLLIKDDQVISAQTTPLFISKVGVNSKIYYLAHKYPAFFGIGAIFLAVSLGYLANVTVKAFIRRLTH